MVRQRSGVSRAHLYDPDVNPTYCDFANHMGFAVLPTRPYSHKDKAAGESAIGVIQRGFFQEVTDYDSRENDISRIFENIRKETLSFRVKRQILHAMRKAIPDQWEKQTAMLLVFPLLLSCFSSVPVPADNISFDLLPALAGSDLIPSIHTP